MPGRKMDGGPKPVDARWARHLSVRALLFVVILTVGGVFFLRGETNRGAPKRAPLGNEYVAEQSCAECHARAFKAWSVSHHAKAMQRAADKTILADFNDARFTQFGVTTRFFKRGEKFFVNTEGPDGRPTDFEIKYTFGVDPLQQYLIEFPGGRLQCLTIAWDTPRKHWFSLYPKEKISHDDPLHWTGRYQNWNLMCAACHSTNLRKGYNAATDSYKTTWSVINVGCQTCHGPGRAHVAWARAVPKGSARRSSGANGLLVHFSARAPRGEVDTCAPCHARREELAESAAPGRPFLDNYLPVLLREGEYYPDGQQLGEVYVWGSFLQTKMYARGVRCTDCHEPHRLGLWAQDNTLCTRCHQLYPDRRFPTLRAKNYDSPAHHFHRVTSPGARCVNCHMPERMYMIVDARRDHAISVPRPDLTMKLGVPNACNGCHPKKSARWAADKIVRWYGPKRSYGPDYAETIASGRAGRREAASPLIALVNNPSEPGIVRATALELLSQYGSEAAATLVHATKDPDPMVRAAAVGGLDHLPAADRLAPAAPLLKDPVRAVRTEAARVLAAVPAASFRPERRRDFEAAFDEFLEAKRANADMPASHLGLGVIEADRGKPDRAEREYKTAIRMDPFLLPAQVNLANLYNQMGRNADAEGVLREAIARVPEDGELRYLLGLLLAEENRMNEAADELGKAVARMPDHTGVRYNYALALQRLNRRAEAESELLQAHRTDPRDPKILWALAVFYVQAGKLDEALRYARELSEAAPDAEEARGLVERIETELSSRKGLQNAPAGGETRKGG